MGFKLSNLLDSSKIIPVYLSRLSQESNTLPPFSIEIHPTSACNYSCIHCSYGQRNKSHQKISENAIKNVLNELTTKLKPNGIYLSGGGEPLTFPFWKNIFDKFTTNSVSCALISNGSLLKKDDIETLSKLTYIAISVYSTKYDEYKYITRGNNFENQFSVPELFESRERRPQVGARCVINGTNYRSVFDVYNQAIDSGFDYIIFIPAVDYENRGVGLKNNEIEFLYEVFSKNKFDNSVTNISSLIQKKFSYYKKENTNKNYNCHCLSLRTNAFINYDGGVYLCQPHIGNIEYCIGNVNNNSFGQIYNGEKHNQVIERLNIAWKNGDCANCRCIGYNERIEQYKNTKNNTPIQIVKDDFL